MRTHTSATPTTRHRRRSPSENARPGRGMASPPHLSVMLNELTARLPETKGRPTGDSTQTSRHPLSGPGEGPPPPTLMHLPLDTEAPRHSRPMGLTPNKHLLFSEKGGGLTWLPGSVCQAPNQASRLSPGGLCCTRYSRRRRGLCRQGLGAQESRPGRGQVEQQPLRGGTHF